MYLYALPILLLNLHVHCAQSVRHQCATSCAQTRRHGIIDPQLHGSPSPPAARLAKRSPGMIHNCSMHSTDILLFNASLSDFTATRLGRLPTCFDFSADGCSDSPEAPFGFDFKPACNRHDFGYRNYRRQQRLTSANRETLDRNFHRDLGAICARERSAKRRWCQVVRFVYFSSVRMFGSARAVTWIEIVLGSVGIVAAVILIIWLIVRLHRHRRIKREAVAGVDDRELDAARWLNADLGQTSILV